MFQHRLKRAAIRPIKAGTIPGRFHRLRRISSNISEGEDPTLDFLRIGPETRVIYQGFTGRVASKNAADSIAWGTKVVGGVKPGVSGEHLDLPVCSSVQHAKDRLKPDATAIFVPMTDAAHAIEEAIEAEIPLIVCVTEHIPQHDVMRAIEMLKTTKKSRLLGPNTPGIISPTGRCRIGFQPLSMYMPGHVGVVAKSGTLSYEAVASLTRAGLGQSLCIGVGGDYVPGTSLDQGLQVLLDDPNTHAVVLVGEIGGKAEEIAAIAIGNYNRSCEFPKPVLALVAGRTAPYGRTMGHAGAMNLEGDDRNRDGKYEALQSAGAIMCDHPEQFGPVLKTIMNARSNTTKSSPTPSISRRTYHTHRRCVPHSCRNTGQQKRWLQLSREAARTTLSEYLPKVANLVGDVDHDAESWLALGITLDRQRCQPTLICTMKSRRTEANSEMCSASYRLTRGPSRQTYDSLQNQLSDHLLWKKEIFEKLWAFAPDIYEGLSAFYAKHEAIQVLINLSLDSDDKPVLSGASFHLDDAAFKSAGRQAHLFTLGQKHRPDDDPLSAAAEGHGICYVTLNPTEADARIGTLVNGAGLAMNTVDCLQQRRRPRHHGGPRYAVTNFLDTGGKATAETVRRSLELVVSDPRTRVVLVNIFGGLTDCGVIADGVLLASREVDLRGCPVVVRLRGTNEGEGQRKLAESGLGMEVFDGFDEAAARVMELAYPERGCGENSSGQR